MKLEKDIQKEIDRLWDVYNESIDKMVESGDKDGNAWMMSVCAYTRLDALNWVLEKCEEGKLTCMLYRL